MVLVEVEQQQKDVILLGKEKLSNGMPVSFDLGLDAWTDRSQEPYRGFVLRSEGTEGGPEEIDTLAPKMRDLAQHHMSLSEEAFFLKPCNTRWSAPMPIFLKGKAQTKNGTQA